MLIEDNLSGDTIELDVTSGRQVGESVLDLSDHTLAGVSGQGAEPLVETELAVLVSDEVEDRQDGLVVGSPQSPAELLQKHS